MGLIKDLRIKLSKRRYAKYAKNVLLGEEVLPYGQWCLENPDIKGLTKAVTAKKVLNDQFFEEQKKWVTSVEMVNGVPTSVRVPLNPIYAARATATKQLKKALKDYSGSAEYASDRLFELKVEADKEGKDWTQIAVREIAQLSGKLVETDGTQEEMERIRGTLTYCNDCIPNCAGHIYGTKKIEV
jgi:hypothetical protein